jgi:hypothetical protein
MVRARAAFDIRGFMVLVRHRNSSEVSSSAPSLLGPGSYGKKVCPGQGLILRQAMQILRVFGFLFCLAYMLPGFVSPLGFSSYGSCLSGGSRQEAGLSGIRIEAYRPIEKALPGLPGEVLPPLIIVSVVR